MLRSYCTLAYLMVIAEKAAVKEKNQKKMDRTMHASCRLECRSQTDARGGCSFWFSCAGEVADNV